jgi:hypothetical protein
LTVNAAGRLTWTPTEAQGPSTNVVLVKVTDNGEPALSFTNSFTLAVREVNTPPVPSRVPPQTADELAEFSLQLSATDSDLPANTLTYSLSQGPSGMTVTPSGRITWVPSEGRGPSVQTVVLQVQDSGAPRLSAPIQFEIEVREVNSAPAIANLSDQSIHEGELLRIPLSATDPDLPANGLRFERVSGPSGLSVSPSGEVTWRPTEADGPSTNVVQVRVVDTGTPPLSSTNRFTVVVREQNEPPVLAGVNGGVVDEGSLYSRQLSASDPDLPANRITYSLVSGPIGLTVSPAGLVTWTPTESQGPSQATVRVRATDNGTPAGSDETSFTIAVREVNEAPVLASVADQVVNEGSTLAFSLSATDPDLPSGRLGFRLVNGPRGFSVANDGSVRWRPTEEQGPSTNRVVVQVRDEGGLSADRTFQVVVREVNQAPQIAAVPSLRATSTRPFSYALAGTDQDVPAQTLAFAMVSGPANLTVSPQGGVRWTPNAQQTGRSHSVRVSLSDGIATVFSTFAIHVGALPALAIRGAVIDGYVAGATLWFDGNLNGVLDPDEPSTTTDRSGNFTLEFDAAPFDRNSDGELGPDEGRIVAEGGIDLSSGQERVGQLTAPAGSTVISPITTLVDSVSRQNPGLGTAAAEERVRTALDLPSGVPLTQFDPVAAAVAGDTRAGAVQSANASIAATIVQIASVLDGASSSVSQEQAAAAVTEVLARQVSSGSRVDLGTESAMHETISNSAAAVSTPLPPEVSRVVAEVVSGQNAANEAAADSAGSPLEAIHQISQVQSVAQGETADALTDLGAGQVGSDEVTLRFTGEALEAAVVSAPTGDVTGTNRASGTFEFLRSTGVATEDGRSVEAISVARRDGAFGVVRVRLDLAGPDGLLKTNAAYLEFADGVTQQTLDFATILNDDALPQADRTVTIALELADGAPASADTGELVGASLRVVDNDSAGSVGFASSTFVVSESGEPSVELVRTGGTAGRISTVVRLNGGTATAGTDYPTNATVSVDFGPGVTRRSVRLPLIDDLVMEDEETLELSVALGTGSAIGAGITPGSATTTVTIEDGDVPSGPTRLTVALLPNGRLRVEVFGPAGQTHVAERTTDMLLPWSPVVGVGVLTTAGPAVPVSFELPSTGIDSVLFRLRRP